MIAKDFLQLGLPGLPDTLTSRYKEVREQAHTHTMRGKQGRILDKVRPNRPASINRYVKENVRNITMGEYRMILMKLSRIMKANDLRLIYSGEKLTEWVNENPFEVLSSRRSVWDWVYEKILPTSFKDPNALLVAEPYWMGNIPPAADESEGGIPENEVPKVRAKIVPSSHIRGRGLDLVAYWFDTIMIKNLSGVERKAEVLMIVDRMGFNLAVPRLNENGEIIYSLQLWFSLPGVFPVHALPGYRTDDENGENEYLESFVQTFFEYGDEFISSFSDNQGVRVQHIAPKYVVDGLQCQAPGCNGGQILQKGGKTTDCKECHGRGISFIIDPYAVMQRAPEPVGADNAKTNRPAIEMIGPPESAIRLGFDISFELLQKGKHSVGLELAGRENESAEAKKLRLEDQDDMIQAYSTLLMVTVSGFLTSVEAILEVEPSNRLGVEYSVPHTFMLQTAEQINQEFTGTHLSVRQSVFLSLVEARTNGNTDMVEIYKIAQNICPWLLYTEDELQTRFASGVIDRFQIYLTAKVVGIVTGLYFGENKKAEWNAESDLYTEKVIQIARDGYNTIEIAA